MIVDELLKRFKKLPPELQREVMDYVEFLERKYLSYMSEDKDFEFSWEGCLKDIRDKYTSVELQHKALEWW